MQDMKMRDQLAGMENAGKVSMESQSVKKCLKVVVLYQGIVTLLTYLLRYFQLMARVRWLVVHGAFPLV